MNPMTPSSLIVIFVGWLSLGFLACTPTQPTPAFLQSVLQATDADAQQARASALLDSLQQTAGIPFIQGDSVFYLVEKAANSIHIAGDISGWEPGEVPLFRLGKTRLWYRGQQLEANARLEYKYVIDGGEWILDPLNPKQDSVGDYGNSLLMMPDYVPPAEVAFQPEIPHGRLDTIVVDSVQWPMVEALIVYLPPGYDSLERSYPSGYFHDGLNQIRLAQLPNILDNLIHAQRIEPMIAICLEPKDRNLAYAFDQQAEFAAFVAQELVPWVEERYRIESAASRRASIGASFGGLISARLAFGYPEVFGLCGSHSGAYWPKGNDMVSFIEDRRDAPVTYAAVWGSYESVGYNNQRVREILEATGKEVYWRVLPEGHTWALWRATMDELLEQFFPFKGRK